MDAPDRHNGQSDEQTCLFVRLCVRWSLTLNLILVVDWPNCIGGCPTARQTAACKPVRTTRPREPHLPSSQATSSNSAAADHPPSSGPDRQRCASDDREDAVIGRRRIGRRQTQVCTGCGEKVARPPVIFRSFAHQTERNFKTPFYGHI